MALFTLANYFISLEPMNKLLKGSETYLNNGLLLNYNKYENLHLAM